MTWNRAWNALRDVSLPGANAALAITSRSGSDSDATWTVPGGNAVPVTAAVAVEVAQAGPNLFCAFTCT